MLRDLWTRFGRLSAVILCGAALAGCETLPRSGPDDGLILSAATASVVDETGEAPTIDYAFVDLTSAMTPFLSVEQPGAGFSTFGGGRGPSPEILIGVGDVIQITIFESQGGGLFVPDDEGSARTGNFVTLPEQRVDRRGFVTVPYAGQVRALGRALPDIEADIVSRIIDLAIEPQVTISLVQRNSSNVTVSGDVNAPLRFELLESGERILDALARAGGLSSEDHDSFVTLARQGRAATIYYPTLLASPNENIFVAPGDVITVTEEQRRFMSFGATGLTGEYLFDRANLELTEALAKAGGLLDTRADPAQVLIYRHETRHNLERMGVDVSEFDPSVSQIHTIFRVNFRKPDAYFIAGHFEMRDGDVIYVSNADSVELFKFLDLITGITGAAAEITSDIDGTINNVDAIFD
ncbi:MAG: polysaccharide biosynthesis/export family protein [Pseudomonadota bacterium]